MHTTAYGVLKREKYDVAVFTSIAATAAAVPGRLRRSGAVKNLVFVLWDFFPVHQIEIGRLPSNRLVKSLRWLEYFSFATADRVAVMSPANERFFRAYFPSYRGKTLILPPWAQTDEPSAADVSKAPVFTAVFGGQLVKGRGVETILKAAEILESRDVELEIMIAGDGVLRETMEGMAASLKLRSVKFLGSIPRPEYRRLLKTAHVGIAATVTGVSVPAFPSKIVEYCRASIPVVACLDPASDAGDVLLEYGAGVVLSAGDANMLADALERLSSDLTSGRLTDLSQAARKLFDDRLSSTHAARTILSTTATT
ncbi:glycosyltransferase involved in cell wall biosynthesis [Arthrobacter bambusae]|uniref:Glycosyltransferase involved in cell wall biosynthesis n=2 Tax=Arthrobacter bambusae TaxID=1338426 RepID=A0AAW8D8P7_9MICC|nr:glycosyltransferase involved in cell wall biosynthesis [Arthrobacter bambusae]MDQ0129458.1 glycosyltransferase involved in cell wall biosynthesis [Arthrobacter bambusae]MDQ0180929.1 glycosyltransferase involved in cell wall biosynthesis [Arthrobacter bambusae]